MITLFLNKLIDRQNLTLEEAQSLMEGMLAGKLLPTQIAAILTALRMKGETVDEILGFISVIRKHMLKVKTPGMVIDTCGTGGDGKGTFNISTAVAFVAAGAGVKVAKHGNRNASSLCGSADVLEILGININHTPDSARQCLEETGFVFLFAPLFHPAMKHVGPVRKELKIRTVFNYLGPFVSPAGVKRQVIGVPNIQLAEKLSKVAIQLGYEHLLLVSSEDGLDEISLSAKTIGYEIKDNKIRKMVIDPKDFGFDRVSLEEIKGGDAKRNAKIIKNILERQDGPKKDIVVLNSAAVLFVAGKAKNIKEGLSLARQSIGSGKAKEVLERVITYED